MAHAWGFAQTATINVVVVVVAVVVAAVAWCKQYPPSPEKYSEGTMFSSQMIFSVGYSGISLMTSSWDRLRSCFHTWGYQTGFCQSCAQYYRDKSLLQVMVSFPTEILCYRYKSCLMSHRDTVTRHVHNPIEKGFYYKAHLLSYRDTVLPVQVMSNVP